MDERRPFEGFLPPISSTTYCPNQFFDVVLRRGSRGAVRLVAYLIRKTLGWSDAEGRPQEPRAVVSWRELETCAGIGHSSIAGAVKECLDARYIVCVRPGRPDRAGERAACACYELRWDEGEVYVTDPERFDGFYAGNGNLTYIPNDYFDLVVPNESLSVLRIVGAIIRHTIGFQTRYGFRRQEIRMSHAALQRYANLSHEAVRLALQEAMARNYVVCLEPGVFDTNAGRESRPATYGIRWLDGWNGECSRPAASPLRAEGRPEPADVKHRSAAGAPLRNVVRDHSDNLHGDRSERLHGKEITENNPSKQQQWSAESGRPAAGHAARDDDGALAAAEGISEASSESRAGSLAAADAGALPAYALLLDAGFDTATAGRFAASYSPERISRQCAWLPGRNPQRNRVGLLRKSIEEDWPEPAPIVESSPAFAFARGYYSSLSGPKALAPTRPSAEDLVRGADILERIAAAGCDVSQPTGWGTEFGQQVRREDARPGRSPGSLAAAAAAHGDRFLYLCQERRKKAQRRVLVAARREHQVEHQAAYQGYLRACRDQMREGQPDLYRPFEEWEHQRREELRSGFVARAGLTDRMLAVFDREEEQLTRFWLFFSKRAEHSVLDFWGWDEKHNPGALSSSQTPTSRNARKDRTPDAISGRHAA